MNTDLKETKNFSVRLTKEDARVLDELASHFGETKRDIIKRGLILLAYTTFNQRKEESPTK